VKDWKAWGLVLANLLMMPILALAWLRLGAWEALAWLGALLLVDWRTWSRSFLGRFVIFRIPFWELTFD